MNPTKKIIVALDQTDVDRAFKLVDDLGEEVDWYKIGPILYTYSGEKLIEFLHRRKKKIFLDLKLHDTPYVVSETMRQFVDLGVHLASVHTTGGRKMLEAAGRFCRGTSLKLIGIGWLTSHEASDLALFGMENQGELLHERLLNLALESRLSGILCAPNQLPFMKSRALPGFLLLTAGIRLLREIVYEDDQFQTATPNQALEWGADYLVVGRPIIHSREPMKVLQHLFSA